MPSRQLRTFCLLLFALLPAGATPAESVRLARDGTAQQSIVIVDNASAAVRQSAATLAEYLRRICGGEFQLISGDSSTGIAVGLPVHFPTLGLTDAWLQPGPLGRERYLLRSHAQGLYVVDATEMAVEHAVWDLLYRIGYRQFFPGPTWEVVPEIRDLTVTVDTDQSPDYHNRRIWYGFGAWDYAEQPYREWCRRNRTASALTLNTGHAYGGIVSAQRAQFAEHPEYFALVDGRRQSGGANAKFCISNPGLRRLVVQYATEYFDRNPAADSVSVDPSDGGGWCQCAACARMGSVSDRAVTLANEVAEAVAPRGKLVGMYAYNCHCNRGNVRIDLWQLGGASESGEQQTKVAHDASVPPDGIERTVRLQARQPGLHRIAVSDGNDMTRMAWSPGTPITLRSSLDEPLNLSGRWTLYFYVPPSTKTIGLFGGGAGRILDPEGQPAFALDQRKPGYYRIPVPPGQDGRLWRIDRASGAVRLLTVPPYLARSADELLLPQEVVAPGR